MVELVASSSPPYLETRFLSAKISSLYLEQSVRSISWFWKYELCLLQKLMLYSSPCICVISSKKMYRKSSIVCVKTQFGFILYVTLLQNTIKDFANVVVSSNHMATKREWVWSIVVSVLSSSVCIPFSVRKQTHRIFLRAKFQNGNL